MRRATARQAKVNVLELPVQLTQASATASLRDLAAALRVEPAEVVVSAAGLDRFDSAALAVLLSLRRNAMALGKSFAVAHLPQRLADLARLYGIEELLPAQATSPPVK
jgi:phospholipid transport system transporter-binding protein